MLAFLFLVFAGIRLGKGIVSSHMILSMRFCDSYESVTAGLEENENLDVKGAIKFNGIAVPYVYENNTFYISQDMDTDSWSGFFKVSYGYGVYFLEDDLWNDKKQAISSGHIFSVMIQRGNQYRVANLVISGLPIMELTETPEMDRPLEFTLLGGNEEECYEGYCNTHLRGQTSTTYPKQGYKVELCDEYFDEVKVPLLGLRCDDDWILNPMYTDSSKIREKLAYQIWADMQENGQTQELSSNITYIELIFNNCYFGLYGLMEPVDEKQLSLNKTDMFWRKTDLVVPEEEHFAVEDEQEYIPGFRIKYPKVENVKAEDWAPLQPYVETFYYDIYNPAEKTEMDWNKLSRMVDVENIIDYEILLATISGEDNIFKNIDYCMRYENGEYVMHMVPWDMDCSLGNMGVGAGVNQYTGGCGTMMVCREFITLYRADNEKMENALRERWTTYRQDILSTEYLQKQTESYMEELVLSGAMERDSEKWPECNNFTDLSDFQSYIEVHMESLDTVFAKDEWWRDNNFLRREEQWEECE